MNKIKKLSALPKWAKFLDPWGNQWKKVSKKHDMKIRARIGEFETEFSDRECYVCSREEALADLKLQLENSLIDSEKRRIELVLNQMNCDPYETIRVELERLLSRGGMSFNGRSVDMADGIRNILLFYPKLPKNPTM